MAYIGTITIWLLFIGSIQWESNVQILFESEDNKGIIHGFTENYIKVKHPFDTKLSNQIVSVTLNNMDEEGVYEVSLKS